MNKLKLLEMVIDSMRYDLYRCCIETDAEDCENANCPIYAACSNEGHSPEYDMCKDWDISNIAKGYKDLEKER